MYSGLYNQEYSLSNKPVKLLRINLRKVSLVLFLVFLASILSSLTLVYFFNTISKSGLINL